MGDNLKTWMIILLLALPPLVSADIYIAIIQGLAGEDKYKERFEEQVNKLADLSQAIAGISIANERLLFSKFRSSGNGSIENSRSR